MLGLFVTGTDTGVGKTVVSAALVAAMAAAGERPRAYKPVVTGLDEQPVEGPPMWPADHELLGMAAGMDPRMVSPLAFGPAVSPHLAAELAGRPIGARGLIEGARAALAGSPPQTPLIVEGVGGLLVPFGGGFSICDLAAELGLPMLIVARPGLGTINHTLLTLRVARASGLDVRAVVLSLWPQEAGTLERSNRETIATLGEVEVAVLERVERPDPEVLARAGASLPWRRWLAREPAPNGKMPPT
jgi:dethiobiotin synthetase